MRNMKQVVLDAVNRFGRSGQLVLMPKTGTEPGTAYAQDSLWSEHNHEFMTEPRFARAYQRGVQAGGFDYGMHWRVHVALWVAEQASRLEGDFVECGVGRGFVSSAILEYLPWASLEKTIYLFDTFTPHNVQDKYAETRCHYADGVSSVEENFRAWPNVRIVPGLVPDSIDEAPLQQVAYIHTT